MDEKLDEKKRKRKAKLSTAARPFWD